MWLCHDSMIQVMVPSSPVNAAPMRKQQQHCNEQLQTCDHVEVDQAHTRVHASHGWAQHGRQVQQDKVSLTVGFATIMQQASTPQFIPTSRIQSTINFHQAAGSQKLMLL
jgi:hypothetical protein